MTFSPAQESLLLVALGAVRVSRANAGYRRYYNAAPGTDAHTLCEELVGVGAMTRGTHGFYYVTEEAAASLGITLKP